MLKRIISALAIFAVLCSALAFTASADDAINGYETEIENDFIPDHLQTDTQRNITRQEFCATLVSLYEYLSKIHAALPSENPFTDTDNPDVLKAYQLGIVKGCGAGLFMPGQELNVEQKAVMLYNTLKLLDPSIDSDISDGSHFDFSDAESVSAWAVEAIEYLYHHGILNDDADENINPAEPVTVDSANLHAQITLDHYDDLTTLTAADKTQLLGCSAKDTRVTMADSTLKYISEIKRDDKLLGMDGKLLYVMNVVSGAEESVITIRYGDDGYIAVSKSQPLATERGVIRAQDLRPGDQLLCNDGSSAEIKFVYQREYNDTVYQLVFDYNGQFFVANGIFVGDLYMQNEMDSDRRD